MASFGYNVDTQPMASELRSVSQNVNKVSGAVVAMQAAVIAAEKQSADHICANVNKGFYALMHSQISQKIAQLTSTVEAKLMELANYASALSSIQQRMENDYKMITTRYQKLFRTINTNLEMRVAELDMPVFKLVDRDIKVLDSRARLNSALFSVNQMESVLASQMLASSKMKKDADNAMESIRTYVKTENIQAGKSQASMQSRKVDKVQEVFLPVSIIESVSASGTEYVDYHVARTGDDQLDRELDNSVREHSMNAVLRGKWTPMKESRMSRISNEFNSILAESDLEQRVKDEIARMFAGLEGIQQLNA